MIGIIALLSVLVGVSVGVLVHNAALGIATSTGLTALLSCGAVLVVWKLR